MIKRYTTEAKALADAARAANILGEAFGVFWKINAEHQNVNGAVWWLSHGQLNVTKCSEGGYICSVAAIDEGLHDGNYQWSAIDAVKARMAAWMRNPGNIEDVVEKHAAALGLLDEGEPLYKPVVLPCGYADMLKHRGHQLMIDARTHEAMAYLHCVTCKEDVLSIPAEDVGDEPVIVRHAVKWFAEQIELHMRETDYRGGWGDMEMSYISIRATRNAFEAYEDLIKTNYPSAYKSALDAAAYLLMLATQLAPVYTGPWH